MKKIILIGFIWLSIIACDNKKDAIPEAELKTSVVSNQQLTSFRSAGEDLKVQLLEVSDSRCPINANCIVAGNANVKFNITDGTNQTNVFVVFSGADKTSGIQEFKLADQLYKLAVTEITPYPEIAKTPELEDYKVNVSITKK